jgi:HEAT repeat protein
MGLLLKQNAAEALGRLGDVRAVEPLIEALQQEDGLGIPLIHPHVVNALGQLGGAQAIEGLQARLRQMDKLFADCDRPDRYDDLENEYLLIIKALARLEVSEK